jgi:hypothetical protein
VVVVSEQEEEEEDADDPEDTSDDEFGRKTVRIIRLGGLLLLLPRSFS